MGVEAANGKVVASPVARAGPGRPRRRPDRVVADKGYSARTFHACLR
ncbi:hypothetical protein [Streptomyces pharetrae]